MARTRRRNRPWHHSRNVSEETSPAEQEERPEERSLGLAIALGIGAAAVLFLIAASLLTIPLFALARFTEPSQGTGREWFREGLRWAVWGGVVVAVVAGTAVAYWIRRGARIPEAPKPWEVE